MLKKTTISILVILFLSRSSIGAEVVISNDALNTGAIFISGKIEKGDFEKVQKITKDYVNSIIKDGDDDKLKYILNSPGGDVEEAIKIGLLFRRSLAHVYVWGNRLIHESEEEAQWVINHRKEGWAEEYATQDVVIYSDENQIKDTDFKKCYSACVLMFLGGIQKQISDNHYWINGSRASEGKDVPVIGLHRPYFDKSQYSKLSIQEAEDSYKNLEKAVREYLEEIGATRELVDRMFKSPSNEIDLVKDSDFREMFHQKEPFYEEWVFAKCGISDDGKNMLAEAEHKYINEVWAAKTKEVKRLISNSGGGPEDYDHIYTSYIPEGFSKEKYDEIMSRVREHNYKVRNCEMNAVKEHQLKIFEN